MSKEIITKIEREAGYLYYVDGEGNVCRTKINRGGKKKKPEKDKKKKVKKK